LSSISRVVSGGLKFHLITPQAPDAPSPNEDWLDLDSAAVVEVSSEEKGYPVESALVSGETQGWRAADSGTQTIRLVFDVPQRITRVWLVFEETEAERTQELVLRWFSDGGHSLRSVRQQWKKRSFSANKPKASGRIHENPLDQEADSRIRQSFLTKALMPRRAKTNTRLASAPAMTSCCESRMTN
jgi:hypothetical protein